MTQQDIIVEAEDITGAEVFTYTAAHAPAVGDTIVWTTDESRYYRVMERRWFPQRAAVVLGVELTAEG